MDNTIKIKIAQLKAEAVRCRQKAETADTSSIADALRSRAADADEEARQLEKMD